MSLMQGARICSSPVVVFEPMGDRWLWHHGHDFTT